MKRESRHHLLLAPLAITALLWLPLTAQALPPAPSLPLQDQPVVVAPAPGSAAPAPAAAPAPVPEAPPAAPPAPPAAPEVAPPIPGPGSAAVVLGQPGAPAAVSGSGEPTPVPPSLDALIDAYKTGGWLAALALGISILVYLLRLAGLLDRLPKRWRPLVPLALGCVAAVLASVAAGLSWPQALYLALLSGPAAIALHQGVIRAVCGVESPNGQDAAKGGSNA